MYDAVPKCIEYQMYWYLFKPVLSNKHIHNVLSNVSLGNHLNITKHLTTHNVVFICKYYHCGC